MEFVLTKQYTGDDLYCEWRIADLKYNDKAYHAMTFKSEQELSDYDQIAKNEVLKALNLEVK